MISFGLLLLFLSTVSALSDSKPSVPDPFSENAISVEFDRQNRTYFKGEDLKFKIIFNLKKEDPPVKEIRVSYSPHFRTIKLHCWQTCRVDIVNDYNSFIGFQHWDKLNLTIGKNEFSFRVQITDGWPSSFEGPYGFVRYLNNISIVTDEKSPRLQYFKPQLAYVINGTDLSRDDSYEKAVVDVQKNEIGGKRLDVKVSIPKNGWVFPEPIPVTVSLENSTNWIIKHVTAEVVMCQNTSTHRQALGVITIRYFTPTNFTVASGNFNNSKKEDLKSVTIPIAHKDRPFPPTFRRRDFVPLLEISHYVKVKVELVDSKNKDSFDLPIELNYELQVTFGIIPTKNTGVSRPDKMIPAHLGYQNQTESVVLYPSFEKLRKN